MAAAAAARASPVPHTAAALPCPTLPHARMCSCAAAQFYFYTAFNSEQASRLKVDRQLTRERVVLNDARAG
jgi:hypothetical protein